MNFEKLRDMESFTDAMFNRIFFFQERNHPAWDPRRPFAERIKDLPLHFLIFNNADRDPAVYSHTIAPYYPLRDEMQKMAYYAKQVADEPVVADLHAGNGFIGSLIAREGVKVIGISDPQAKRNQIESFYDPDCYQIKETTISEIDFPIDVVFSSWMPSETNVTPDIVKLEPKLIIYTYTEHVDDNGVHQTGTPDVFNNLPDRYQLVDAWSLKRPRDLLHEVWPDLTPSLEETRHTRIYADEPYHGLARPETLAAQEPFDWERELEIAILALEAKNSLRAQGII